MTSTLAVAIVVLCVLSYATTLRSLTAQTDRSLLHETEEYAAAMIGSSDATSLVSASYTYLQARTEAGADPDPILLVVIPGSRALVNSSVHLEEAVGNSGAEEPTSAPAGFTTVRVASTDYRVVTAPIIDSHGQRVGVFQAALSAHTSRAAAASVAGALAVIGLAVMFVGVALSRWVAGASLRPLRRMADDAATVSHAAPGRRIAYEGPADELGSLADSLNAMLDRLEHSYENQRRFVGDASHELRTPMAIILGNVEVLRSGRLTEKDADESLAMIEAESARMTRLLDELLSLARLEGVARDFQPLDVATILHEAAARARSLGNRRITVDCTPNVWISGNPDLVDQAVTNILRNAITHTNDGGRIALACTATATDVALSVTDDGPGISQDDLDRIFDRFYRARGPRPGGGRGGSAGLGLAIAKRLVDLHGGTIAAANDESGGARFTISLPRITPPEDVSGQD